MPLIQPEKKMSYEQLKLRVSSDSLQELHAYGRFLNNSSPSYILTQLIATLGRDKEFQQWKETNKVQVLSSPTSGTKSGTKSGTNSGTSKEVA
jgi:hypothetical protein